MSRFEVYYFDPNPTVGSEMNKPRPCVIVSPDEINHSRLPTVIIAPITSTLRKEPTRIPIQIAGRDGNIVLEQIRAVDRSRLRDYIGNLSENEQKLTVDTLVRMFSDD